MRERWRWECGKERWKEENEGEINHVVAIIPKMPSIAFSTGLCE